MKKRNIELRKLKFSKTNIASLEDNQQIMGGNTMFTCINSCPNCTDPPPSPPQVTMASGCLCPSQVPLCQPTEQNCITQHTCGGNFLCDNQIPGGRF